MSAEYDDYPLTDVPSPMTDVDRLEQGRLASEARHGAAQWRHTCVMASIGWVSGLGWEGNVQLARILSGLGQPPHYIRERREPDWPIYRAAILAATPSEGTPGK